MWIISLTPDLRGPRASLAIPMSSIPEATDGWTLFPTHVNLTVKRNKKHRNDRWGSRYPVFVRTGGKGRRDGVCSTSLQVGQGLWREGRVPGMVTAKRWGKGSGETSLGQVWSGEGLERAWNHSPKMRYMPPTNTHVHKLFAAASSSATGCVSPFPRTTDERILR